MFLFYFVTVWDLRSSWMLRSVDWLLVSDVSAQTIDYIFKNPAPWNGSDRLFRNVGDYQSVLRNFTEERIPWLNCCWSLKTHLFLVYYINFLTLSALLMNNKSEIMWRNVTTIVLQLAWTGWEKPWRPQNALRLQGGTCEIWNMLSNNGVSPFAWYSFQYLHACQYLRLLCDKIC